MRWHRSGALGGSLPFQLDKPSHAPRSGVASTRTMIATGDLRVRYRVVERRLLGPGRFSGSEEGRGLRGPPPSPLLSRAGP
jgi:hypothetical protein